MTIAVNSASGLKIGDHILISQTNDPSVCENMPSYTSRAIAQIVQITGISGTTISINRPLYYTYSPQFEPTIAKIDMIQDAGVEDLHIERI